MLVALSVCVEIGRLRSKGGVHSWARETHEVILAPRLHLGWR